jgi:agmatine deiminase
MVGPNIKTFIRQICSAKVSEHFKYSFDASMYRKTGNEGGAIDTNGRNLLTSEECLMHPDIQVRNHFTKNIEAVFKEYLGITNVIWRRN